MRAASGAEHPVIETHDSALFNAHWLRMVQSRARSEGRRTGASIGCGIGAIVLLPFGPIAMCVCGLGCLLVGFLIGLLFDMRSARTRDSVAEKELKRLTYLVRFASDQISRRLFIHSSSGDTEYCLNLLESVILEFKPFVEVAHLSPAVHKKLNLLYTFLRHAVVRECLWLYVNNFLSQWRTSLTVMEFVRISRDVLTTLVHVERVLGVAAAASHRLEVIVRVEEFLNQPKVKAFNSAHWTPSDTMKKNLEAVLVREHQFAFEPVSSPRRRRLSSVDLFSAKSEADASDIVDIDDEFTSALFEDSVEDLAALVSPKSMPIGLTPRPTRPFFKSYKDFIEFDTALKHRMPISDSEYRFLYEKEAEPLTAPGWELAVDRKLIKVLKFIPEDSRGGTAVLVRAYATLPNVSIETAFFSIFDPKKRQSWDSNFCQISVLPNPECEILYCVLQSPFGVTPRDFLQYRKAHAEDESTITILMRSAEHPDKPELPGSIRAETYISGYVLRQRGPDCALFLMSQTDVRGLIPKWIVNMMAAKAPAQWIENLGNCCKRLLDKDFGGDEIAMKSFLAEYVRSKVRSTTNSASV